MHLSHHINKVRLHCHGDSIAQYLLPESYTLDMMIDVYIQTTLLPLSSIKMSGPRPSVRNQIVALNLHTVTVSTRGDCPPNAARFIIQYTVELFLEHVTEIATDSDTARTKVNRLIEEAGHKTIQGKTLEGLQSIFEDEDNWEKDEENEAGDVHDFYDLVIKHKEDLESISEDIKDEIDGATSLDEILRKLPSFQEGSSWGSMVTGAPNPNLPRMTAQGPNMTIAEWMMQN